MKQAILAAEDERFYQHPGVDTMGVLRAAYANFSSGGKRQGASTITMQVARNFFLSSEKTLTRKLYEALLAFKIETIFPRTRFSRSTSTRSTSASAPTASPPPRRSISASPEVLSIAEAAMLAGLPKAPSSYNPVANPKRAKQRQLYVLRRMRELGFINDAQLAEAQKQDLRIKRDVNEFGVRCRLCRRDGAADGLRTLPGRGLHPRPSRHHHHPQGGPGGGLCQPAARQCSTTTGATATAAPKATPTSAARHAARRGPGGCAAGRARLRRHPCRRDSRSRAQAGEGLSPRRRNGAGPATA
jgi:hypothetical protein